jgi:hypothetical protein
MNRICLILAGLCLVVGVWSCGYEGGVAGCPETGEEFGLLARQGSLIGGWVHVRGADGWFGFYRPTLPTGEPPGETALGFRCSVEDKHIIAGVPLWFIGLSLALVPFARQKRIKTTMEE